MVDQLQNKIFKIISNIVDDNNIESYVIGGFVRDILLKRDSKDIDVVVVGSGISIAKQVAKKVGNLKVSVFKTFGTAMFKYNDVEVEFVGARKESYNRNSRKPTVENGTLKDDQERRDFTINALAISLNNKTYGKLIDPFGGINDLENKIIKTPLDSDITFSDDPLRMLRAIRFATQLDFTIEEKTFNSIVRNKDRINIISKERIVDELNKIVMSTNPSYGFRLLDKSGLLKIIFPELYELKGVEIIDGLAHKENFDHTVKVLDNLCRTTDDLWLRWAAIFHDIAKTRTKKFITGQGWTFHAHEFVGAKMVPKVFNRMKLPMNEKMKFVQKMVLLHLRPINLAQEKVTDSAVRRLLFDAGNDIDKLMLLAEADITSNNRAKVSKFMNNFALVRRKLKEVEEKDNIRNWKSPISGELIISTFKISPSKTVGIIKDSIKDAILDGEIENNYESAYNFMLKKGSELGLSDTKGYCEKF